MDLSIILLVYISGCIINYIFFRNLVRKEVGYNYSYKNVIRIAFISIFSYFSLTLLLIFESYIFITKNIDKIKPPKWL